MSSPTSRTLALYRKQGYLAGIVEKWVPQARRRVDLFGFVDVVAIPPIDGTRALRPLYVQATSGSNHSHRREKILCDDELLSRARQIVASGASVVLVSWAKRGPRGKRKVWTPRVEVLDDEIRVGASE